MLRAAPVPTAMVSTSQPVSRVNTGRIKLSSPESWVLVVVESLIVPLIGTALWDVLSLAALAKTCPAAKKIIDRTIERKIVLFIVFSFTQWWARGFPPEP
jgi:hypothetical protein